jgi:branched-chain amino acid transport system permease protein
MKFSEKQIKSILLLLTIALAFIAPVFVKNESYIQILIVVMFFMYITTAWNFVGGFAGVLPLGHAAFIAIGAYTSTILFTQYGISPWIGMFVGGLISAVVGILIGLPTFKLRGAYFALATIAFGEGIRILFQNIDKIGSVNIGGARGILISYAGNSFLNFQWVSRVPYYYIILIMLIILLMITVYLMNSKMGYYLTAGGEDPEAAASLGINVAKYKLTAMALSAFFTAIAGTFYAQWILYIYPNSVGSLDLSFEIAFIAIIGGRGTIIGPILGALLLKPLGELTRTYFGGSLPGLHLFILGLILVLVMIYQPRGIQEILTKLFNRFLKKFAKENQS